MCIRDRSLFLGEVIKGKHIIRLGLCLIALLTFAKLYFWFGWMLTKDRKKRVRLAYLSAQSRLADLGVTRDYGETRKEFAKRLGLEKRIKIEKLTSMREVDTYSKGEAPHSNSIEDALEEWSQSFKKSYKAPLRILSFLSPGAFLNLFK